MTDLSANATDLGMTALTILREYIEALLPTLEYSSDETGDENRQETFKLFKLLWIAKDQKMMTELESQLNLNNDETDILVHLSTLSELNTKQQLQRYQLACFWLPNLSSDILHASIPLLMRYRDLYAAHLLIVLDSTLDLRAYGFTPLNLLGDTRQPSSSSNLPASLTLWQFNLYDYKRLPNWLNADYWANPENWDKHRW
ncbi:DUF6231 family protein [Psychrobacter sp. Cmf 22.2]|uniref:DUF6231 family protein n=1 Tax=Psychrobacter sp. Cmf 22.2 TaxID=1926478 RepID=UPI00096809FB|nr:DUF6231 family protein [Psychrobacter sp. Cmf 22.2]OLF38263.1 hypothetical protein BTV98_05340 [Psychrobacter sp. Cmf 22.2]